MLSESLRLHFFHGLQLALGLVWVAAGVAKLRTPRATALAVGRLTGAPPRLARPLAWLLPIGEVALGAALIADRYAFAGALTSIALFTLFAVLIIIAAARDALGEGGCGCFGAPARRASGQPDLDAARAVGRNIALVALALLVVGANHRQAGAPSTARAPARVAAVDGRGVGLGSSLPLTRAAHLLQPGQRARSLSGQ
jgi:hypothetical protein